MTKPTALIFIGSQQKGFLISLAELLAEDYKVVLIAAAADVEHLVRTRIPGSEIRRGFNAHECSETYAEEEFRQIESKYGERLSFLCAQDRALGHGYLFNIDVYPDTIRTGWSGERKYSLITAEFRYYERLVSEFEPVMTISIGISQIQHLVFSHQGTKTVGLGVVKYGNRLFWFDNPKFTSRGQLRAIERRLGEGVGLLSKPEPNLELEQSSYTFNRQLRFSLPWVIADAARLFLLDTRKKLSGTRKKNSYRFAAWVRPTINKWFAYRLLSRIGIHPSNVAGRKIIYVPLHLEPEVALLSVSPEFNNSMELVSWVSRNVSADTLIVVKEHPVGFGVRSRGYYRRLATLPNVAFAHPKASSQDWILAARVVATFTGTAGVEAIYFKRPVLSFGAHQAINRLPTVRFADRFCQVRHCIEELIAIGAEDIRFHLSKWALHYAMLDISFPSPGFESSWSEDSADHEQVRGALRNLYDQLNLAESSALTER